MKNTLFTFVLILSINTSFAQRYQANTLSGLFWDYTTNAASESLGKNSVTFLGIQSAWENPAAIMADTSSSSVAVNYTVGHPYRLNQQYMFFGGHLKIGNRFSVGLSSHSMFNNDPVWTSIIAGNVFQVEKVSERAISCILGFKPIDKLSIGLSGNMVKELFVNDTVTIDEFILNFGVNYWMYANLLNPERFLNQKARFGFSMTNVTMVDEVIQQYNEDIWQYRDFPIIIRYGGQYTFDLPFRKIVKLSCLREKPNLLSVSVNTQLTDWVTGKDHSSDLGDYNTIYSFGLEAMAYRFLALRLGFYRQSSFIAEGRLNGTKNRRMGLTSGLGFNLPLHETKGMPFDLQFDIMIQTHPDYLDDDITTYWTHPDMKDGKLMASGGLKIMPR